jgi:hypothetical protein
VHKEDSSKESSKVWVFEITRAYRAISWNALPHQEPWFEVWPRRAYLGWSPLSPYSGKQPLSKPFFYNILERERSMRGASQGEDRA